MGKRLSDNLSSLYIGAANRLKSKKAKRRIIAYVESYDDISFWHSIFSDFEDDTCYFEVMLPSNKSLCKGKKSVLMNQLGSRLGENMVACVDSDYDYLLQGVTSTSRQINNSRFVFQTYAYAIENYQCYAESLHEACVMATLNDHPLVDLVGFMTMYSQIAYPLFIWSVWFYRKRNLNEFSLTDFCSYVRLDHVSVRHPEHCLMAMEKRVKHKLQELEKTHPKALDEIEAMKAEFTYLGVTPENTYMFIQGHHIMESVVMKVLTPICNALRREREEEIKYLAEHHTQYRNELTSYERRMLSIDVVLRKHTGFKESPVYKKLENDIREFLKRIK
ncbi:MAG: DUF4435 domain-containing protein [Bacteroidaceae bacterium]|nr:DUF4435 domain-containing protein [Bacteroidaceae bacterium]